ncbi:MAG TPA: hypothetical protein VFL16_18545 [Steroidobacteraceae bacterium]|jgi:hypothetical protein|nr:hypothetical protein [Steroidobacteraceae bacterium]
MINRTSKYLAAALALGCVASGHAATAPVSPALAACSKALVESISGAETLPAYTIKPPSRFADPTVDRNSFTVLAHGAKSGELLAKASCRATPGGEIVSFKSLPVKS